MVQFLSTDYGIFPGAGAGVAEVAGAEADFRALERLIVTSSLVSVGPETARTSKVHSRDPPAVHADGTA